MNNKVAYTLIFIAGAAAGVVSTWKYHKSKYEKKAQEDFESIQDMLKRRESAEKTEEPKEQVEENVESKDDAALIQSSVDVISADEFGDLGYETISYEYDKTTKRLRCESVDPYMRSIGKAHIDIIKTVGLDAYFDDERVKALYLRNDADGYDYEIILDDAAGEQ